MTMTTNNTTPLATVSEVTGKVWVMTEDGSMHLLYSGDYVYAGEVIRTEDGGMVRLTSANGAELKVTEGKEIALTSGLFDGSMNGQIADNNGNTLNLDLTGAVAAVEGARNIVSTDNGRNGMSPDMLLDGSQDGMQNGHGFYVQSASSKRRAILLTDTGHLPESIILHSIYATASIIIFWQEEQLPTRDFQCPEHRLHPSASRIRRFFSLPSLQPRT